MMNKALVAAALLVAAFVGCTKATDEMVRNTVSFTIEPYNVIEENEGQPRTRTTIVDGSNAFLWAKGDTVGIYPNSGSQVYFNLDIGADASTAVFDGGGWDFKASAVYYSYYPFIGDIYLKRDHVPVSYVGQKQTGKDYSYIGGTAYSHIGPFDYMCTPGTPAENGSINFSYRHLGCIIRLRMVLPAGTYTKLAITAPEDAFTTKGYFDLTSSPAAIIPTAHSNQLAIDLEGVATTGSSSEVVVYVMSAPVDLMGKEITISVLNSERKEYQCKKTPSYVFNAGDLCKYACTSFSEVPQSMGLITSAESITLNKTSAQIVPGSSVTLTAAVLPETCDDSVRWTTSDASVATVSNGVVTGVAVGTAVITASVGNLSASCEVTVTTNAIGDWDEGDHSSGNI